MVSPALVITKPHTMDNKFTIILIIGILLWDPVGSQQFGRNKVVYDEFNFRVLETPNFRIHHYLEDEEEIMELAQLTERWYQRHLVIFQDTLETKIPVIFYNNHADFQQTTVIQQLVGVGTGGVTEGMRKRVVMPISPSRRQTNHVLGHELTHVHHFRLFLGNGHRGLGGRAMQNVPLWMTEGQSEYLSIGRNDTQTAMWMRDAVKHDNIPTLRDMTTRMQDFFPYRWGHAFWAYFTGHYGDGQIMPLFIATAQMGLERAIDTLTGYSSDSLSALWANELRETYLPQMEGKQESVGEKLFDASNAGDMNIAPAISPDGENIIFISNMNVISIDFILASVREKEVTRRITNIVRDAHIDEYNYLESAGTWNPQGTHYALTTFSEGRNRLVIADLERRQIVNTIDIPGLHAFNNPDWSPDGERIVVSGLREGKSDLYAYNIETGESQQLTDDRYAALQPSWSPDGSKITFITDREGNTDFDMIRFGNYRLAEYDLSNGAIEVMDILRGADIINPKYSPDGSRIFFVSNADGFRNIYYYHPGSNEVRRVTDLQIGVSGITELSPCFDIARESDDLVYILYNDTGYELFRIDLASLTGTVFTDADVDLSAGILPPVARDHPMLVVDDNLESYLLTDTGEFRTADYDPDFSLEFIGSAGIGVGVSQFGAGAAGGVSFMFSDMLRENIISTSLQVQGRIIDIAGQAVYVNQSRRLSWGGVFSHIPYRSAGAFITEEEINGTPAVNLVMLEQRVFEDELGIFGQYPFSRHLRLEGGVSASLYSFRVDSINNYYIGNRLVEREQYRAESPESFFMYRTYLAYVGDRSQFGLTSPMSGFRYRFQVDRNMGEFGFWGLQADYRQYRFIPPVALGLRLLHFGRYGRDSDRLQPVFIGNPFFVRGYRFQDLTQPRQTSQQFMSINNLLGSKIAVMNAEFRLPFTGPRELALIRSGMFFSDLVLFADGGLAWNEFDDIRLRWSPERDNDERIPVFSTGVALRANLFGAIIVEPYFALPFQRQADRTSGTFGFHLSFGGF
jgi:Tol biopolymer transport system component